MTKANMRIHYYPLRRCWETAYEFADSKILEYVGDRAGRMVWAVKARLWEALEKQSQLEDIE